MTTPEESENDLWDKYLRWECGENGTICFPFFNYILPDSSNEWNQLPKAVCDVFLRQVEAASKISDLDSNPISVWIGGKCIPLYSERRAPRGVKNVNMLKGTEPDPSLHGIQIYGVEMHMNKSKRWISKGENKSQKGIDKPCRIRYTTFSEADFETETNFTRHVVTRVEQSASVGIAYIVKDGSNKKRKVNEMSGEQLNSPSQSNSDDVEGEYIVYDGYKSVQTQLQTDRFVPETIRSALETEDYEAVADALGDLKVSCSTSGTIAFTSQESNGYVGSIGVNALVIPAVQSLMERADNTDAKIANLDERVKYLATNSLYLDTPDLAPTLDSLFDRLLSLESRLSDHAFEIHVPINQMMKILQEIVRILHEDKGEYVPLRFILNNLQQTWPYLTKQAVNHMMYKLLTEIVERKGCTKLWRLRLG